MWTDHGGREDRIRDQVEEEKEKKSYVHNTVTNMVTGVAGVLWCHNAHHVTSDITSAYCFYTIYIVYVFLTDAHYIVFTT